jgi:nitrous oxidase accessory protein NosD
LGRRFKSALIAAVLAFGRCHPVIAGDVPEIPTPAWSGAGTAHDGALPTGRVRPVTTVETLRRAIDSAMPGDVILLQPGTYRIVQSYITISRPGAAGAPITVRAPRLGSVILESELGEAVKVDAPYWYFENLVVKGVCADDTACDNGLHIVGGAHHTIIRNLRVEDFNAQIKINGENGQFPDGGQIEHSTLIDTHPRRTGASVTPIDLVAANNWIIQGNLIADFGKEGGNRVSYGGFAKGAGHGTIFARNVVLCEWRSHPSNNATIGLSFGGGGTDPMLTRGTGLLKYEHADGLMSENLIAFCSDTGIYLNRAANSVIRHNTLIGTSGIDVRYPESIARVDANIVDGTIRMRDHGLYSGDGNETENVRALFENPARLDLRWQRLPALVATEPGLDLCGAEWTERAPAGAFRDFRACGATEKPAGKQ